MCVADSIPRSFCSLSGLPESRLGSQQKLQGKGAYAKAIKSSTRGVARRSSVQERTCHMLERAARLAGLSAILGRTAGGSRMALFLKRPEANCRY